MLVKWFRHLRQALTANMTNDIDCWKIRDFVIMMRNGKRVETIDAEETQVADGDEIAVFPPFSGG
jgi:molybdopterin converting factor small subunit